MDAFPFPPCLVVVTHTDLNQLDSRPVPMAQAVAILEDHSVPEEEEASQSSSNVVLQAVAVADSSRDGEQDENDRNESLPEAKAMELV